MSWLMDVNNFNQRGVVHNPQEDLCRTIIGGGGQGGYHAGNEPKVLVRGPSVPRKTYPGQREAAPESGNMG